MVVVTVEAQDRRSVLSLPGSRVLLAGCGHHTAGSHLPDIPSVSRTITDLADALGKTSGLDAQRIRLVVDPHGPVEFGDAIVDAAEQASDVLLVYYVGHGLIGRDGQLYLATQASDDLSRGIPGHRALAYSAVSDVVAQSRARLIIILLDCSFAARAFAETRGGSIYLLAATGFAERALAPPGQPHTAFTGELIRLLNEGDPAGPQWLTLADVHRGLDRALLAKGMPRVRRQANDISDDDPIAINRAYREPEAFAQPNDPAGGTIVRGHAFLSYVHENSDKVDWLQQVLQAAGVQVWRDTENLWPGEDWRARIRQAITQDALAFVACFSRDSTSRSVSYMNEELLLAVDQLRLRRPDEPWLIPVRLDDCVIPEINLGGGRTLASIQHADLFGTNLDEAARRLVASVSRILSHRAK
jgi:hypothetical protein